MPAPLADCRHLDHPDDNYLPALVSATSLRTALNSATSEHLRTSPVVLPEESSPCPMQGRRPWCQKTGGLQNLGCMTNLPCRLLLDRVSICELAPAALPLEVGGSTIRGSKACCVLARCLLNPRCLASPPRRPPLLRLTKKMRQPFLLTGAFLALFLTHCCDCSLLNILPSSGENCVMTLPGLNAHAVDAVDRARLGGQRCCTSSQVRSTSTTLSNPRLAHLYRRCAQQARPISS